MWEGERGKGGRAELLESVASTDPEVTMPTFPWFGYEPIHLPLIAYKSLG